MLREASKTPAGGFASAGRDRIQITARTLPINDKEKRLASPGITKDGVILARDIGDELIPTGS